MTTSTFFDCFADLQIDSEVLLESDLGARFDKRLLTRQSAPPLWSTENTLPDCAALVRRASRAKANGETAKYEAYMQQLVRFFENHAPARTPDQVRRAFQLGQPTESDSQIQKQVEREMPFLDAKATKHICCAKIDVSKIDALHQAEKERKKAKKLFEKRQ